MNESNEREASEQDQLIPLVVGVTGHRDLWPEDVPRLEGIVQEVFDDLRRRHPSTPILVLSPLAEGADRLVARVAVRNRMSLVVPRPRAFEDSLSDFSAASRAEFDGLLQSADSQPVVRSAVVEAEDAIVLRESLYEQMGLFVAVSGRPGAGPALRTGSHKGRSVNNRARCSR
jgi:hypothetical protein